MTSSLRRSPQTLRVLLAFLASPRAWRYGYDLSQETGVKSGTLYPLLMRLEENQLVESNWQPTQTGRPPRHMYRLTPLGVGTAREYVRNCELRFAWGARVAGAEG